MAMAKWWVAAGALCLATGAQAQDAQKTRAYIAPYAGGAHLRLDDGVVFDEADPIKFDALQFGAAFGFRFSYGLVLEIGRSHAIHADIFDEHGDFELLDSYGAVGWSIPFAEGWRFTPKLGRMRWELSSDHRVLLDQDGERHYGIDGWENFYELGLSRQIKDSISLGVVFRDVDQQFGHERSGSFVASFSF